MRIKKIKTEFIHTCIILTRTIFSLLIKSHINYMIGQIYENCVNTCLVQAKLFHLTE